MNIPNRLSLLRILLVPVMIAVFLVNFPGHIFVTIGIFILAAFTDFLDGKIARKYNMITDMGKFLDPIADKMLSTTALILLACYEIIPNPYGMLCLFLFFVRDNMVSCLRQIAATKGVVIAADWWGKYKTFVFDVAVPVILLFVGLSELGVSENIVNIIKWIGYGLMIVATTLNTISGIVYYVNNKQVFKESK
ncbi:MAG: CDP-diacylglycerol--glycerol-3-phosphate 3-phosphatidyltransferase [Clostridiales bacterium]|nr:CDP-diacylglycerol--glycerol-3-phosphate 3-phosphatidyltransferase [Candidatus Apopatousia equi]